MKEPLAKSTGRKASRFFPPLTVSNARSQLKALRKKLDDRGTLHVQPNKNGIYSASASQETDAVSGYQDAWLRDNAMIAFSLWHCGNSESAFKTIEGLTKFLQTQTKKIEAIIDDPQISEDVQRRPHVRFNAKNLQELKQTWAHAQNDALGYVVWLRFRLAASEPKFQLSEHERNLYDLLPPYFHAIRYWEDLDSGAWEESRKVNSSSVAAVVAALLEFQKMEDGRKHRLAAEEQKRLQQAIDWGKLTLERQLPFEAPPGRRSDAALLLMLYPLQLVGRARAVGNEDLKNWILSLVRARLVGSHGVKRYTGDSYFCQDYDKWLSPEMLSSDFSSRVELRDELLQPGCEAQWTLFDPLLSSICGEQGNLADQIEFLNRAIAQITEDGGCPELYYLKNGSYVPNDHTPLAWTQANLAVAVHDLDLALNPERRR